MMSRDSSPGEQAFAGQNILITGGASGIGLATARLLKKQGAQLILWDINAPALEAAARELDAQMCVLDVRHAQAVTDAMAQTAAVGNLHLIIHAAGVMPIGLFDTLPLETHQRIIETNLWGTVTIAHAAIPYLKRSRGGLVLFGSVASFYGSPEFNTYAATKAAVLSLAQSLRIELQDAGVYVGVVHPHFVDTPLLDEGAREGSFIKSKSPLMEMGTAEQTARALLEGIVKRRFMIYTGWRSWLIFTLSRYAHFMSHSIMRATWRGLL